MSTISFSAALRTREYIERSTFRLSAEIQEFYDSSTNFVGIISFTGLNLANKMISCISLTAALIKAGFGVGHKETVSR